MFEEVLGLDLEKKEDIYKLEFVKQDTAEHWEEWGYNFFVPKNNIFLLTPSLRTNLSRLLTTGKVSKFNETMKEVAKTSWSAFATIPVSLTISSWLHYKTKLP